MTNNLTTLIEELEEFRTNFLAMFPGREEELDILEAQVRRIAHAVALAGEIEERTMPERERAGSGMGIWNAARREQQTKLSEFLK